MDNIEIPDEIDELKNLCEKIGIECKQLEELNIINSVKIKNYKMMMENIILEFHKLCMKLSN